jgi:hypothetical protein
MVIALLSRIIITIMRISRVRKEVTRVNDYISSNFSDIEYPSILHENVEV